MIPNPGWAKGLKTTIKLDWMNTFSGSIISLSVTQGSKRGIACRGCQGDYCYCGLLGFDTARISKPVAQFKITDSTVIQKAGNNKNLCEDDGSSEQDTLQAPYRRKTKVRTETGKNIKK